MIFNLLIALAVMSILSGVFGAMWALAATNLRRANARVRHRDETIRRLRKDVAWSEELRQSALRLIEHNQAARSEKALPHRDDLLEQLYRLPAVVPAHEREENR